MKALNQRRTRLEPQQMSTVDQARVGGEGGHGFGGRPAALGDSSATYDLTCDHQTGRGATAA